MGNKHGFSMVQIMVGIGILAITSLAIFSLNAQLRKEMAQSKAQVQVGIIRHNLVVLSLNDNAWLKTLQANSAGGTGATNTYQSKMACLLSHTTCAPGGAPITNQKFAILDAAGTLYFDATNPRNGMNRAGGACNTYPSDACPFRYDLVWSAVCTGSCIDPTVRVTATFSSYISSQLNAMNIDFPPLHRGAQ